MSQKNQSPFEDLIEVALYLPWRAGLILAVVSYFVFHLIAGVEVTPMTEMKGMGGYVVKQGIKTFAQFLQYIIPIAFIVGFFISTIKQRQRRRIYDKQTSKNSIRDLSWQSFELLISEAFRIKGYQVTETQDGPDGGVDLILKKK